MKTEWWKTIKDYFLTLIVPNVWVWSGLYLFVIMSFGLLYGCNSSWFAQTTTKLEESYKAQEITISKKLIDSVGPTNGVECSPFKVKIEKDDDHYFLEGKVKCYRTINKETIREKFMLSILVPATERYMQEYCDKDGRSRLRVVHTDSDSSSELGNFFTNLTESQEVDDGMYTMFLIDSTFLQLVQRHFMARTENIPSDDFWVAGFYLSVVTVTTLGFGDIVPVNSKGRWSIGFEVIAGIIIFGFFINAVTKA
jgi:hypothetical protein